MPMVVRRIGSGRMMFFDCDSLQAGRGIRIILGFQGGFESHRPGIEYATTIHIEEIDGKGKLFAFDETLSIC